jgi:hypothetical protein
LRAGETAWIARRENDGLSDDLSHNAPVLVLFVEGPWAFIRDGARKQRRLAVSALDAGSEYQGRSGYWYAEDHPRVQEALAALIEKLESEGGNETEVRRLRGVLDRHPEAD